MIILFFQDFFKGRAYDKDASTCDSPGLSVLEDYVDELLDTYGLPEIDRWEEWYEPLRSRGKIQEFFRVGPTHGASKVRRSIFRKKFKTEINPQKGVYL